MKKKVLICRIMPYSTMLNRAHMFKAMGWEPYLLYEQPFANSKLLRDCARTFEEIWSQDVIVESSNSFHDFIRTRGFDLVYTIGPPDRTNVHMANIPCPWIHDMRDLFMLTTPKADDPEVAKKMRKEFADEEARSATCINACDMVVYVTPWQRERANAKLYPGGNPKPSVWLPNVPLRVPEIKERDDDEVLRWGYVGNMKAAWQDAPTYAGHIAAELDRIGVRHEFHVWSFMEMQESQPMEWFFSHNSLAQEDLIKEFGETVDYGILFPPTASDGSNGKTGWPGKVGDYIASGVTALVPHDFMIRHPLRRNGWGIAYETPKDVARILSTRRRPTEKRAPAPYLLMPEMMKVLEGAVAYAMHAFKQRKVEMVAIPVKEAPLNITVASDCNEYHAKEHIAPILGSRFVTTGASVENGADLYLLGMWARNRGLADGYMQFFTQFKRIIIQWAGTDAVIAGVHATQEWFRQIVDDPRVVHVAPDKGVARLVDNALSAIGERWVPCRIIHCPTRRVYEKPFELPRQFAVSVYYPAFNREVYSLDLVDEVIARMKDTLFYLHRPGQGEAPKNLPKNAVWLGEVPEATYPEFLKQVSVLLRLTVSDGTPYTMIEHFCAGRNAIMHVDYPFVTKVPLDAVEVVKAINTLKRERKYNMAASDYWRAMNDFGRFRKSVEELFEEVRYAGRDGTEAEARHEEAGVQ